MKLIFHIFRTLLVSVLVLLLVAPNFLYAVLPLPAVQNFAAKTAREELTKLLGTPVEIGTVSFSPFNRLIVEEVIFTDNNGKQALRVGHLGAGISLLESLTKQRWAISYAELLDVDVLLYRDSVHSPLNIDPIIARFKTKPGGQPAQFDLSINGEVVL